ncbi:hypothetical protein [Lederbergia lenta]|uniref:hypothetical protein n=1 Tax=Lederbergia lenta TaxID=1467 RepID=UPI00204230F3|nr:hypothetical protein [Lederbergia lenta]MCM3109995.1 hypothetical protein [Lederbergia lenta]
MNHFTYEVLTYNEDGKCLENKPFNTHLESKIYYQLLSEDKDVYHVEHIKITNGNVRKMIRCSIDNFE